MQSKVLLVDDDPNVLSAYKRVLRRQFKMDTAGGGLEAIDKVNRTPYAVIVSDLQMPGMNGISLLEKVKSRRPDTVTMMLTGNADLTKAIAAVNQGHVFRFLTKPCTPDKLADGISAALHQYQLVQAERVLLEKTLKGAICCLTQTLSLACPDSFSRATRMERLVKAIVSQTNLADTWEFEVAASLSQLGTVALPAAVLRRLADGEPLAEVERRVYEDHPKQGALLLANIPRLETVQSMVAGQMEPYSKKLGFHVTKSNLSEDERVSCGSQLIRLTHDYDLAFQKHRCSKKALKSMLVHDHVYQPELVNILARVVCQEQFEQKRLPLNALRPGMILCQDILGRNDRLMVKEGQEVTDLIVRFLEKVGMMGGLATKEVDVSVPMSSGSGKNS